MLLLLFVNPGSLKYTYLIADMFGNYKVIESRITKECFLLLYCALYHIIQTSDAAVYKISTPLQ